MTNIKKLSPFKHLCMTIGNLPSSYVDSMSYYECVMWLCKYLKEEVIPVVNNNSKVVDELIHFFETLDVQDEINTKLDEMSEDGSLLTLFEELFSKTNGTLTLNIDYRTCSEFIPGVTDESSPIKGYIQGMTTTPSSYIVARQTGGSYENNSNMIYLEEISKSTGQILKSAYLELDHANSIAYNQEASELYVALNSYFNNEMETVFTNDIAIVDYESFTIKDIVTPTSEITNINRVRSVSYDNKNKVLALADTTDVFIMEDFNTIKKHIKLDTKNTANINNPISDNITNQHTVVYDNKIYSANYFANGIVVYDINGNLIENYYDFEIDIPVQMGELESISIEEDGTCYIASVQIGLTANTVCKLYDITIFKTNLKYNGYKNYWYSPNVLNRATYYVDSTTTNKYQAGTSDAPFKHIEQAIMASNMQEKNASCNITLVGSNKNYGFFNIKNNCKVIINGNGNNVYCFQLETQDAIIKNLNVIEDTTINMGSSSNISNVMINDSSNIHFVSCTFKSAEQQSHGIIINNSIVKISTCTFNNFVNAIRLIDFSQLYVVGITIQNCSYYWYNGANCIISFNSPANLQRSNPSSNTGVIMLPIAQDIPYTFTNNKLTFNNITLDTGTSPTRYFKIEFQHNIESKDYISMIDLVTNIQPSGYSAFVNSAKTAKYEVFYTITHSSGTGIYDFVFTVIKTDLSTGTITNLSNNVTTTIRRLQRIQ